LSSWQRAFFIGWFMEYRQEEKKEKSRASKIIDGDIEPEENERYLLNLRKRKPFNQWDPEKMHEVAVKGGEAVQKLHGKKKTAKQALADVLTLKVSDDIIANADIDPAISAKLKRDNPDATLYDLIQAVAVGRALEGNVKAMEYIRDTHGDAPIKQVEITENITTDADRALLQGIAERLQNVEIVQTVEAVETGDDIKGKSGSDPDNMPS